jgi:hypothetical protein
MLNRFRIKRLTCARLPLLALLVAMAGCARIGAPLIYGPRPDGAPKPRDLLASLGENDRGITNFRVKGKCTLTEGEIDEEVRATIEFRRPDDAYMKATKFTPLGLLTIAVVRGTGDAFVVADRKGDETLGWPEGLVFESIPFASTPADMVREVFLPIEWDAVRPWRLRYETFNEDSGTLVLTLSQEKDFSRRLTLQGPPWVVVRSEMFDRQGVMFSSIVLDDYRDHDGTRFPASATVSLPREGVTLALDLNNIILNKELNEEHFTIDEQEDP